MNIGGGRAASGGGGSGGKGFGGVVAAAQEGLHRAPVHVVVPIAERSLRQPGDCLVHAEPRQHQLGLRPRRLHLRLGWTAALHCPHAAGRPPHRDCDRNGAQLAGHAAAAVQHGAAHAARVVLQQRRAAPDGVAAAEAAKVSSSNGPPGVVGAISAKSRKRPLVMYISLHGSGGGRRGDWRHSIHKTLTHETPTQKL